MAVVDGTLRLHPCPECGGVGALLQLARTRATRALNADERRTFLHEMSPPRAKPGPP
jgi:transposase